MSNQPSVPPLPTLAQIEAATDLVRRNFPPTLCYAWPLLAELAGCEVWVKHENHTPTGAFKIRAGLVYLDELLRAEPSLPGIIAASTGNHGQSIAWNARQRGVRALIVVPHGNNPEKNASMRALGAELIEHGAEFQIALEHSRVLAVQQQLHPVPSFHPWLVRGTATFGLEMFRSAPPLDVVYVPIGLGSGFCGVAAAREALGLKTRLIGVVSDRAAAYALSFHQRRFVTQPSQTRVSEGVACSTPHELALAWIMQHADDIVTVSDEETLVAMRELLQATHNLAEGSGALAWAAIRKQRAQLQGKKVGCVLTGGNATVELISQALHASASSIPGQ